MQSYALTIDKFLAHAAKWSGDREVVSAEAGEVRRRIGYAGLYERSNHFSGALKAIGLEFGDRIATLAWNSQHHMEIYYAAMGSGLICHTLNPRFAASHLVTIINEAEDRAIAVAHDLSPLLREILPQCPSIEHVIFIDEDMAATSNIAAQVWAYEDLLAARGEAVEWAGFDENTPAGLCYTSGTTGKPKGALYTHRSNYLHTLRALQADAFALRPDDAILVAVPMFHANGWGLPFAGPAVGAKLVLPGRQTDGLSLARLMREQKVTVAAGVQTVWLGLMEALDEQGGDLPDLKRVIIGGSKCPEALIRRMEDRLGAEVQTSWGMTELSPLGTVATAGASMKAKTASGRPPMGLDLKLTDEHGKTLARQRGTVGHLKVRGASVVDRYYKAESDSLDEEGYFDTGDLAIIDEAGNLTISGRTKDLIKSGGEWINPAEIEEIVGRDPAVRLVAVIGRQDEKWGERPVLIIEPHGAETVDVDRLLQSLKGQIATWWIPDEVATIRAMPLAATGKINKIKLQEDYRNGELATEAASG